MNYKYVLNLLESAENATTERDAERRMQYVQDAIPLATLAEIARIADALERIADAQEIIDDKVDWER